MSVCLIAVIVVGNQAEINAGEKRKDQGLDQAGQDFEGKQEFSDREECWLAQFVHGFDSRVATAHVCKNSDAERNVLHDFGEHFDKEDHQRDRKERKAKLWTSEVADMAKDAVCLHTFVLNITDGYQRHSKVKAEDCGWRSWSKQGDNVAYEDDHPETGEHRNVLSTVWANSSERHVFEEEVKLFGQPSGHGGENSTVVTLLGG